MTKSRCRRSLKRFKDVTSPQVKGSIMDLSMELSTPERFGIPRETSPDVDGVELDDPEVNLVYVEGEE